MNKNAWVYFIDAIGEATKLDVLVNGKKVDSYTANIKNEKRLWVTNSTVAAGTPGSGIIDNVV